MGAQKVTTRRLEALHQKHRALDEKIVAMQLWPSCDEQVLGQMKKEKLLLKEEISTCESRLMPKKRAQVIYLPDRSHESAMAETVQLPQVATG